MPVRQIPRLSRGFESLLYRFLLLKPVVEVCQQEMRRKLFLGVIYLEVNRHIVRSKKEVTDVAKRILFMLLYQHCSPTEDVNIKSPNCQLRLKYITMTPVRKIDTSSRICISICPFPDIIFWHVASEG